MALSRIKRNCRVASRLCHACQLRKTVGSDRKLAQPGDSECSQISQTSLFSRMSDKCKMSSKTLSTRAPTTAGSGRGFRVSSPMITSSVSKLSSSRTENSRCPTRQVKKLRRAMRKHGIDTSSMTDEQVLHEHQKHRDTPSQGYCVPLGPKPRSTRSSRWKSTSAVPWRFEVIREPLSDVEIQAAQQAGTSATGTWGGDSASYVWDDAHKAGASHMLPSCMRE